MTSFSKNHGTRGFLRVIPETLWIFLFDLFDDDEMSLRSVLLRNSKNGQNWDFLKLRRSTASVKVLVEVLDGLPRAWSPMISECRQETVTRFRIIISWPLNRSLRQAEGPRVFWMVFIYSDVWLCQPFSTSPPLFCGSCKFTRGYESIWQDLQSRPFPKHVRSRARSDSNGTHVRVLWFMFFCALAPGSPCLAPALGAIVGSREGGGEGAWSSSRLPVDLLVPTSSSGQNIRGRFLAGWQKFALTNAYLKQTSRVTENLNHLFTKGKIT